MASAAQDYQQQVLEAPRPPGAAYVLFFLLGTLAINTFYLVFEQEERRFWLWAALGSGFAISWLLPRPWRMSFHRIIDLGSVLTLFWFAQAMTDPEEQARFGNYLGQMVCVFLVLFSFRTFRHSDFSWLMVIAIVIMLLCSIPIYAASFIYSIFAFLLLLALGLLVLNLYPAEGDHREEEALLTVGEWSGQFGRTFAMSLAIFTVCAGLFAGLPQGGARSDRERDRIRGVFGVASLSAQTRGSLTPSEIEDPTGTAGGASYSGFSESFDLASGRSGAIQEDISPILEVKAPGQPYMRALAWDQYTGRAWNRSAAAAARTALTGPLQPGYGAMSAAGRFTREPYTPGEVAAEAEAQRFHRAEIKLVGTTNTGKGFLFLPWRTIQLYGPFASVSLDDMETWQIQTVLPENQNAAADLYTLERGDEWHAVFEPTAIHHTQLKPVPPLSPSDVERYTALPDSTPQTIRQLGQSLRHPSGSPWLTALRIQAHLRALKQYSLSPPVMGAEVTDVVSYWLENSGEGGHCELFATSAAVLLRAAGVPARTVTGFAPGTYSLQKGAWIIRGKDAHAWVELFVPESGWVLLDPTPASWGEDLADNMSELTSRLSRSLEQYFIYDPRGFWTRDLPNHVRSLVRRWTTISQNGAGQNALALLFLSGAVVVGAGLLITTVMAFRRYRIPYGRWDLLRLSQTETWSLRRYARLQRRLLRLHPEMPEGLTLREVGEAIAGEHPQLQQGLEHLAEPFHHFHYEDPATRSHWIPALRAAWRKVPRL